MQASVAADNPLVISGYSRIFRVAALLVGVSVGVLAVASAGDGHRGGSAASPARSFGFGQFAGYTQGGPVVWQVSATLTVPRVSSLANTASASTWVAAGAVGPYGEGEPFIQVGVNYVAGEPTPKAHLPSYYQVFWSDTAQGYLPSPLFSPRVGDRISLGLTLSKDHWIISIVDGAVHRRIVTAQEGRATFQLAEWYQEHPDPDIFPYPKVSGLRISDLRVDGRAPAQRDLDFAWMLSGKEAFEPSPLDHDGFTLLSGKATVPAATVRMLRRFAPANGAISKLELRLAEATTRTPRARLATWASQLSKLLFAGERTARRQRWPRNAQASVDAMLAATQSELSLTRDAAHVPASKFTEWRARWNASIAEALTASARLLHSLRLPD